MSSFGKAIEIRHNVSHWTTYSKEEMIAEGCSLKHLEKQAV